MFLFFRCCCKSQNRKDDEVRTNDYFDNFTRIMRSYQIGHGGDLLLSKLISELLILGEYLDKEIKSLLKQADTSYDFFDKPDYFSNFKNTIIPYEKRYGEELLLTKLIAELLILGEYLDKDIKFLKSKSSDVSDKKPDYYSNFKNTMTEYLRRYSSDLSSEKVERLISELFTWGKGIDEDIKSLKLLYSSNNCRL